MRVMHTVQNLDDPFERVYMFASRSCHKEPSVALEELVVSEGSRNNETHVDVSESHEDK
jgi:hypothetical protein